MSISQNNSTKIYYIISLLIIYVLCLFSVLLYVREQHEKVFTALLVKVPTLQGLLQAVSSLSDFHNENTWKKLASLCII